MSWSRAYWLIAAVGALAVALSFGMHHGWSNQQTYFIHALIRFDPTLLPNDWYARGAADIHSAWSRLAALILTIHDGPEPFVALELMLTALGCLAVAWLTRALLPDPRRALPVVLGWYALAFALRTTDVMGSFLFAGYLQPSSFGEAGILCAAACLAHRRHVALSVALALGGLLHLNFLALGLATFGLAELALAPRWPALAIRPWQRELWPRLLKAFALPMLVFLWALPQFLEAAKSGSAEATRIVAEIRAPHHFRPTAALVAPLFAWQAAAWLAVLGHRLFKRRGDDDQPFLGGALVPLLAGVGGFVMLCSLLTTAVHVDTVLQLFPWRFAPLATVIASLALLGAGVQAAQQGAAPGRWAALALAVVVVGLWGVAPDQRVWVVALAGAVGGAAVVRGIVERRTPPPPAEPSTPPSARARLGPLAAPVAAALLVGAIASAAGWPLLAAFSPKIQSLPGRQRPLVQWALANTDKADVFAVPPSLSTFRMFARRSVVVDWKSAGAYGTDILEWYQRMNRVAGTKALKKRQHADQGYLRVDRARAEGLRRDYGVRYLVLEKPRPQGAPTDLGKVAFENGAWVVYDVTAPEEDAAPAAVTSP
ncbi:MAG: hypothetical protein HYS27_28365 [Deltaproteobacteria bacterium]|nr:hypothetical protein [Deltaproteobacteria bacterium]